MTTPEPAAGEVRQLLVHPAVWTGLESWLAQRGIEITEVGVIGNDDLPTYAMTPTTIERKPTPMTEYLATPCDACRHTLRRHDNKVGCTVVLCVCGRFQQRPTDVEAGR